MPVTVGAAIGHGNPICRLTVQVPIQEIPDGYVAGVVDPGGNVLYVFDPSGATE